MQVKKVMPSGFCSGVSYAINLALKTKEENKDEPIYIIGHLVHNHYIAESLLKKSIVTIDDKNKSKEEIIDEIDSGIVIFSAHGISDKIKNKAINKGLKVIDATCPFVLKTRKIIIEYLNLGYKVFYIGKDKHPEAMAILSISDDIHLIEKEEDIDKFENFSKVLVTNQTTMSIIEIADIFKKIKDKYPNATILDEICSATRKRQSAINELLDVDLLYVVGDITSNNSNKLKEIAVNRGIKNVRLISNANDLEIEDLKNAQNIYVTSGASTPNYLRDQVIDAIEHYIKSNELLKYEIDLDKLI